MFGQARKLESELDVKLASYRRLATGRGEDKANGGEVAIETLLEQLHTVNERMQAWVSTASSDVLAHTLARHQNIFHELSQASLAPPCLFCDVPARMSLG